MSDGPKGARGRRFDGSLTELAEEVNASVDFDARLLAHDVAGSIAHCRMLAAQGIVSAADAGLIEDGLRKVQQQFESGERTFDRTLEDVHMNVEAALIDEIGDAGRRLHTGRSRNDQVATDLRLYARSSAHAINLALDDLRRALVERAEQHIGTIMPGYTHLQRAQPVRLAHHLMAYEAMFRRDRGRVQDASDRAAKSPLGSGALAATTFPLDRSSVATELGFDDVTANSMDAVGDRDFAVELVAALALCQVHLSRLGEEIVLWLSQEFRFATLSDGYTTGSSLMPQKVNPDLAELIRGKTGRVVGDFVALVTVLKGLPLAYNKDLQETQEPLYDAVETALASIAIAAGMIRDLVFDEQTLARAVGQGYLVATELADYLVNKGHAFREAHDIAGAIVRAAVDKGAELAALPLSDLQTFASDIDSDVFDWLDPERAVDRRDVPGGPARNRIEQAIAAARDDLEITGSH